ncbi:MAG: T9SS type A sorting domain-containing protein [Bacteroidia bacterium]
MEEWICAYNGFGETNEKFTSTSNSIMRVPIQIDRYPDSIRTVYRNYEHTSTYYLVGNPYSYKFIYTSTDLYLKSNYEQSASPFNTRSLDGTVEFFAAHQYSDPNRSTFYLPCYIYPNESPGFFRQYVYSDDPDRDSTGNPIMSNMSPVPSFERAYSVLNGRIDHYDVEGFEFSAGGGICGIYKLTDTFPDTSGYFPVGLPEIPVVGIYPNPFIDHLYVSDVTPYASWSLLNFQGQEIAAGLFESNEIEVKGLADGVYVLRLHLIDGGSHFTRVSRSE